jgi:hypothetical protein
MIPRDSFITNFEKLITDDSPGICKGCHFKSADGTICYKTGHWCHISKTTCKSIQEGPPHPTHEEKRKMYRACRPKKPRPRMNAARKIIWNETGQPYESISQASRELKVSVTRISRHLTRDKSTNYHKDVDGMTFRYADERFEPNYVKSIDESKA